MDEDDGTGAFWPPTPVSDPGIAPTGGTAQPPMQSVVDQLQQQLAKIQDGGAGDAPAAPTVP
eukprot:11968638-Karenia_brevis.AAC.1